MVSGKVVGCKRHVGRAGYGCFNSMGEYSTYGSCTVSSQGSGQEKEIGTFIESSSGLLGMPETTNGHPGLGMMPAKEMVEGRGNFVVENRLKSTGAAKVIGRRFTYAADDANNLDESGSKTITGLSLLRRYNSEDWRTNDPWHKCEAWRTAVFRKSASGSGSNSSGNSVVPKAVNSMSSETAVLQHTTPSPVEELFAVGTHPNGALKYAEKDLLDLSLSSGLVNGSANMQVQGGTYGYHNATEQITPTARDNPFSTLSPML
jgi:hypothetical protein